MMGGFVVNSIGVIRYGRGRGNEVLLEEQVMKVQIEVGLVVGDCELVMKF